MKSSSRKIASILLRVLMALVLGIACSLYFFTNSEHFKEKAGKQLMHMFAQSFDCHVQGKISHINIFNQAITVSDIAFSKDESYDQSAWAWQCKEFKLSFNVLSFFLTGKINTNILIANAKGYSAVADGDLFLMHHVKKIFFSTMSAPVVIKSVTIRKGTLLIDDKDHTVTCQTILSGEIGILPDAIKTHMYLDETDIKYQKKSVLNHLAVAINGMVAKGDKKSKFSISVDGNLELPHLSQNARKCHIAGSWIDESGSMTLANTNASCMLKKCNILYQKDTISADLEAQLPLAFIKALSCDFASDLEVDGIATICTRLCYDPSDITCKGTLSWNNGSYKKVAFGDLDLSFERITNQWKGNLNLKKSDQFCLGGDWHFDEALKQGSLHLVTTSTLALPLGQWLIEPQACELDCSISTSMITGIYQAQARNHLQDTTITSTGALSFNNGQLTLEGLVGDQKYNAHVECLPQLKIITAQLKDVQAKPLIELCSSKHDAQTIEGSIAYHLIRAGIGKAVGLDLPGDGLLRFSLTPTQQGIFGKISMQDGNLRLLKTHNFIKDFTFDFDGDLQERRIIIKDLVADLHKGSLATKRITLLFDQHAVPAFIHAPIILKKIFLNTKKDLFLVASGAIMATSCAGQSPELKRTLLIERAQFKRNVFSSDTQKDLVNLLAGNPHHQENDLKIDLIIRTKNPITIKTPFIEAHAALDLSVQGALNNPTIAGFIEILDGTLAFPYRPLYISSGKIYFLPNQLHDPAIELVAKGKIKNFHVILRLTGSRMHPIINFESTPPLSQDQIITLLLSGSSQGSLSVSIPALIMQNIQNMLVDSEQPSNRFDSYFKGILSPLKHMRIVPIFSRSDSSRWI